MLEHQQSSKEYAAPKHGGLFARQDEREDEHAVEEAIVLEMDVVNDEQAGR